jgi:hypothetical protein
MITDGLGGLGERLTCYWGRKTARVEDKGTTVKILVAVLESGVGGDVNLVLRLALHSLLYGCGCHLPVSVTTSNEFFADFCMWGRWYLSTAKCLHE